jgi:hypothetical protein
VGNRSVGGNAGANGDGGLGRGGALFNNRAVPGVSTLTGTQNVFFGNKSEGGDGSPDGNGGDALGGAVYLEGGTTTAFERSAFVYNRALGRC